MKSESKASLETAATHRARAIGASIFLSSSLFALDASAEPLIWGSGLWGDAWQIAISVPTLSPLALGLLAAALASSALGVRARRRAATDGLLAGGDRR